MVRQRFKLMSIQQIELMQFYFLLGIGQLQSLKTRISPFLHAEFATYQDLLGRVRESEQRFAQRRVQPINCKYLAGVLPDIQAAVRASIISPSEEAKEKLAKLSYLVIEVKDDGYLMEIHLEPRGFLSMEELKQAFQLLDIAALDDGGEAGEFMARTRQIVGLILRLSDVFASLYSSGFVTYNFPSKKGIDLDQLEGEIEDLQDELNHWNELWREIDALPYLALLSRGYLLHMADLVRKGDLKSIVTILRMLLPSASDQLEDLVTKLSLLDPDIDFVSFLPTILHRLHQLIEAVYYEHGPTLALPPFLVSYGSSLLSHFMDKTAAVVILNVPRELLVGSSLAAYVSVTRRPIEPSRILFVTANTEQDDVERFMKLWALGNADDLFIIVHIERLSAAAAGAIRDAVGRVLPEHRTRLLLLAQQHHRAQSTKSLGARLGLVSDRLLEVNFTANQLRQCFSNLLPNAANVAFYTSKLPGCGKSQQVMRRASKMTPSPSYFRFPVRNGTAAELLTSLQKMDNISEDSFLHLDGNFIIFYFHRY